MRLHFFNSAVIANSKMDYKDFIDAQLYRGLFSDDTFLYYGSGWGVQMPVVSSNLRYFSVFSQLDVL